MGCDSLNCRPPNPIGPNVMVMVMVMVLLTEAFPNVPDVSQTMFVTAGGGTACTDRRGVLAAPSRCMHLGPRAPAPQSLVNRSGVLVASPYRLPGRRRTRTDISPFPLQVGGMRFFQISPQNQSNSILLMAMELGEIMGCSFVEESLSTPTATFEAGHAWPPH